jgi:cleavage and polyadenylation specificity factor subunit 2
MVEKFSSREPKLILAVPASMSHGPSRSLFADFAAMQGNVVILTQRAEQGTLSRFLMDRWEASQEESQRWQDGKLGEPVPLDRPIELEVKQYYSRRPRIDMKRSFAVKYFFKAKS